MRYTRLLAAVGLLALAAGLYAQDAGEPGAEQAAAATTATTAVSEADQPLVLGTDTTPSEASSSGFGFLDGLQVVLVLAIVVGAIYALFYFLKKVSPNHFADDDFIRVVSSKSVSGNKAVHVVGIGNQYYLVGTGANEMSVIGAITDEETLDAVKLKASEVAAPKKAFPDLVQSLFGPKKGALNESLSFLGEQRGRLRDL